MPYATENQISQSPIDGGIEITEQQYADALEGMQDGKIVTIDGGFAVIDKPDPEPEQESETPEEIELTNEELRNNLIQKATDKRWEVMTGGLTLQNGMKIGTTIDDQNRITSVVANAEFAGLEDDDDEVDFKSESGWVRITIGTVKNIAGVIGQFVQECYSKERTVHELINALEDEREILSTFDVNAAWDEINE